MSNCFPFVPTLAACLMSVIFSATAAGAQSIDTSAGKLRIGISGAQAMRLLHGQLGKGSDYNGWAHEHMVSGGLADRRLEAILTSRDEVYSISSQQIFPTGAHGRQAADRAFQDYRKKYDAPETPSIFKRQSGLGQVWTNGEGRQISILLLCDATLLNVSVSDYRIEKRDDGIRDDTRQEFRSPIDNCF